jgi:hypothetical protein
MSVLAAIAMRGLEAESDTAVEHSSFPDFASLNPGYG